MLFWRFMDWAFQVIQFNKEYIAVCFQFLVEENEKIQKEKLLEEYNDAYWEQHYTVCRLGFSLYSN